MQMIFSIIVMLTKHSPYITTPTMHGEIEAKNVRIRSMHLKCMQITNERSIRQNSVRAIMSHKNNIMQ